MGRIFDTLNSINKNIGDKCEAIGKGAGTLGVDTAIKMINKYENNSSPKLKVNKDKVNKMKKSVDIKTINKRLDESDSKGEFGAIIDNNNHLILSKNDTELLDLDLSKESEKDIEEQISKVLKENGIDEFKKLDKKNYSNSDILNVITSKFVRNFSVKKVYDSTFGVCYEDEYGSLFQTNPEEDQNANCLWESKTGKRINTDEDLNEQSESKEATEEGSDNLNIDLNEEGSDENADNLENEDLDEEGEDGFESSEEDGEGFDEGFVDESYDEQSQNTSTILATSLDKAVNNLTKVNNKLLKLIENGV